MSYAKVARRIRVPLGFALAILFLWLAQPTWRSLAVGAVISVPGLWLRALAAGHVRKNAQLTTTGPYGHTRNPLYLGSILIAGGFALAARSWWVALAMALMFAAIYVPVIRSEEAFLRQTFPAFNDYAARVPRLIPRFRSAYPATGTAWSAAQYGKHREYNALVGSLVLWGVLVAKILLR